MVDLKIFGGSLPPSFAKAERFEVSGQGTTVHLGSVKSLQVSDADDIGTQSLPSNNGNGHER